MKIQDDFKRTAAALLATMQLFIAVPCKAFAGDLHQITPLTTISAKENTSIPKNELYDLSDITTRTLYEQINKTAEPAVIYRDTSSWYEIENFIKSNAAKNSGDGIVIVRGAYSHIIGAIVNLAKSGQFNIKYCPVENMQISTQTPDTLSNNGHVEKDDLEIQMKRTIGVVKFLDFKNMDEIQTFLNNQPTITGVPTLQLVVQNETGLHHLYSDNYFSEKIDAFLNEKIKVAKDSGVFSWVGLISEGLFVSNLKQSFANGDKQDVPIFKAAQTLNNLGLSLAIGAFGIEDERNAAFPFKPKGPDI